MKKTDHNSTPDLRELSQGMTIGRPSLSNWSKRRLKKLTLKSVSTLNTIPKKYHKKAAKDVMDSVLIGSGLLDLLPFFQSIENIDYKMAHSISLHMTRRLYIDLNFIKMEAKGFKKYEWLHSGGQNLECVEHTQMNGKI